MMQGPQPRQAGTVAKRDKEAFTGLCGVRHAVAEGPVRHNFSARSWGCPWGNAPHCWLHIMSSSNWPSRAGARPPSAQQRRWARLMEMNPKEITW